MITATYGHNGNKNRKNEQVARPLPMSEGPIFQHVWHFDFVEQMIFDRAFVVPGMGAFILKLSTDCFGNFSSFILMMHNGFISKSFTYQLEVACCADHNTSRIYTGEVCSCRTPAMVLNEKCLQIKRADINRMLEHQKLLCCTVLLGKKPQVQSEKAPSKPNKTKKKNFQQPQKQPPRPQNQPPGPSEGKPFPAPSDHQPKNREPRPQTAPNVQYAQQPLHRVRDANLQSRQFAPTLHTPPFTTGSVTNVLHNQTHSYPYRLNLGNYSD